MWAIIWNNQKMFGGKNDEAFLCYRIIEFFKKFVIIIGQSFGKNNNIWNKSLGKNWKIYYVPNALARILTEIIT